MRTGHPHVPPHLQRTLCKHGHVYLVGRGRKPCIQLLDSVQRCLSVRVSIIVLSVTPGKPDLWELILGSLMSHKGAKLLAS